MKYAKAFLFVVILLLLGVVLASSARADQWNKKTIVTFGHAVEVPGKMVLQPGKYVFKLADTGTYRHIVQIWNEDETKILNTILAIPNYRLEPTGESVLEFHERPGTQPQALRAWFYPGDNFGQEFAYPEKRAMELAAASNEIVPAEKVEIEPTPAELESVPLVAVTPRHEEEPLTEAIATVPLEQSATMAAQAEELPETASPMPLIALLGLFAATSGLGLRLLGRRKP